MPGVPVIDYVCPSVWAWRPGRAKVMARHIDHVLALLPFEPAALARLGGPPATYVGHPLTERREWIASLDPQELAGRLGLAPGRPVVVVLPGSRRSEVTRLLTPFRQTLACLAATAGPIEIIIPTVDHVRPLIEADLPQWPIRPHLVNGEADKFKAFRLATASLAASGTVTLELAVAGSPMVVAYKADWLVAALRFLIRVPSVVLANLVLDEAAFPEFLQEAATPAALAAALQPLLRGGSRAGGAAGGACPNRRPHGDRRRHSQRRCRRRGDAAGATPDNHIVTTRTWPPCSLSMTSEHPRTEHNP